MRRLATTRVARDIPLGGGPREASRPRAGQCGARFHSPIRFGCTPGARRSATTPFACVTARLATCRPAPALGLIESRARPAASVHRGTRAHPRWAQQPGVIEIRGRRSSPYVAQRFACALRAVGCIRLALRVRRLRRNGRMRARASKQRREGEHYQPGSTVASHPASHLVMVDSKHSNVGGHRPS